jgi:hypothetical protein
MMCQVMWLTTSSKQPFEVISCRVSSHWRRVALGTPLLWNNIHLHITSRNNGAHHAERLAAYLARSGSCLLDISLPYHKIYHSFFLSSSLMPTAGTGSPCLSLIVALTMSMHISVTLRLLPLFICRCALGIPKMTLILHGQSTLASPHRS